MKGNSPIFWMLCLGGIFFILAGLGVELWLWRSLGIPRWVGFLLALSGICDLLLVLYLKRKI